MSRFDRTPHLRTTLVTRRRRRVAKLAVGLVACVLGVSAPLCPSYASNTAKAHVHTLELPAPAGSGEPQVFVRGSRLYLSWLKHNDTGHELQYAKLEGGVWSDVHTVAEGDHFFANWADVPSVVELEDGTVVAHWLSKSAEDTYAYDVMLSRSTDGVTWSEPVQPHDDGTNTEHGFVSIVPLAPAEALIAWLDGRDYATEDNESAQMSLRSAVFGSERIASSTVLDPRTCDCCPTDAVRSGDAIVLAYRDRSPEEVRDISLVRYENGKWSEPYPLSRDGWQIAGCPVNGPALDARGPVVVASWFTMIDEEPMVRVAFSSDTGNTFPINVRVDEGGTLGRTDVLLLNSESSLVVWIASPPEGDAEIRARLVFQDGQLHDPFLVTTTSASRSSGFPRLASVGGDVYVFWTEVGEVSQVRMARIDWAE